MEHLHCPSLAKGSKLTFLLILTYWHDLDKESMFAYIRFQRYNTERNRYFAIKKRIKCKVTTAPTNYWESHIH